MVGYTITISYARDSPAIFFKNYQLFDFSNDYHYHNIEFMNVNLFHDFNSKVNLEEKSDKLKIIKDKNSRFKHTSIVTNIPLKVE